MNARAMNQRGQATVLSLVFLTVLLGMAALVLDIGSWYRADRATQSTADAAALAGAQALPDTAQASTLASQYAAKNGSGLQSVTFSSSLGPNDTINVKVQKPASGIFTKLFGVSSVNVGSKASARAALTSEAKYVAPIVVKNTHPMLVGCSGGPCFGSSYETTIPVDKTGAPGAFALVNLLNSASGTSGASVLADWILNGFSGYLKLGAYFSDPGVKFNSNQIQQALAQRMATDPVLLFPVYDTLTGTGSNAEYHIIGWAAFHVDSVDKNGNNGHLTGYFENVIWTGLQATSGGPQPPNYGVRSVQLTD